jgi:G3E family GTPase
MSASAVTPVTLLAGCAAVTRSQDRVAIVRSGASSGPGLFRGDDVGLRASCTCCPLAGDLVRGLRELHAQRASGRGAPFERVVVEAPRGADLRPILAALAQLPVVALRFAPGAVVVAADDASLADAQGRAQLAMADRIVWRGASLGAQAHIRLRALNPGARIDVGRALPSDWLDTGLYRGDPPRLDGRDWTCGAAPDDAPPGGTAQPREIRTFAWRGAEPLSARALEARLEAWVRAHGAALLRMKGLVAVEAEDAPRAVHAVGHTLYPSARLPAWPGSARASCIALSISGLEESAIASILD